MPTRVWGYLDELAAEREEILAAINEVLDSGWLILGKQVEGFEQEFASYCGLGHGVGVNSGTDALFLGLKALGLGPGDEVVTVSNTAVPTVAAIVSTGAEARFVDIDPETYLMDTGLLEAAVGERTKCIVAVHLFGQCVDMDAVDALAKERGLSVLEDCAQAHGARQGERMAGAMSDVSAFSFYPTKILGGYGDGGLVATSDAELAAKVRRLRKYGMTKTYFADEHGYNTRLDELHAAILRKKLTHLDEYLARRRALAARYDAELAGTELVLPQTRPGNQHAYYLYVARHPARDRIIEALREHDIHLNVSYPWPIHTMPPYAAMGSEPGDLPHTELAAQEIFSLPMYPSLADAEQERVIDCLKRVLAGL